MNSVSEALKETGSTSLKAKQILESTLKSLQETYIKEVKEELARYQKAVDEEKLRNKDELKEYQELKTKLNQDFVKENALYNTNLKAIILNKKSTDEQNDEVLRHNAALMNIKQQIVKVGEMEKEEGFLHFKNLQREKKESEQIIKSFAKKLDEEKLRANTEYRDTLKKQEVGEKQTVKDAVKVMVAKKAEQEKLVKTYSSNWEQMQQDLKNKWLNAFTTSNRTLVANPDLLKPEGIFSFESDSLVLIPASNPFFAAVVQHKGAYADNGSGSKPLNMSLHFP